MIDICKCFGPLASAVMNGRLMSVVCAELSSFLAFSQASCSRCRAIVSLRRSMPCSFLNSSATWLISTSSKSSPPRCVSPLVRDDAEHAVGHFEDRDVERAAAEVEHADRFFAFLVEAVGQRRGGRLVDDAGHFQAGDLAGVLRGLPLGVVEVGRHGDHGLVHLVAQDRPRPLP